MVEKKKRGPGRPKKKHPGGRPPKMTTETIEKLEYAFKLGCTNAEACFNADISESSLYLYLKQYPEFSEKVKRWKERPILLARKSVVEGLENDPDLALKFLERKKKDEFSTRGEITGANGGPVETKTKLDVSKLTTEQLKAIKGAVIDEPDADEE